MPARDKLLLATSNRGKVREYLALAEGQGVELRVLPGLNSLPQFTEDAPTFAENAAGKALHYSRHVELPVLAEDSGLVVPALGGLPGPRSARYAGARATNSDRILKLLGELRSRAASERSARFVCAIALAAGGRMLEVVSDFVEGELCNTPRGDDGFGYDPIFYYSPLGKTFAELSLAEKNACSHRARAFRKLMEALSAAGR